MIGPPTGDGVPSARAWHALPALEVLSLVGGKAGGLSDAEAARRLTRCGPNVLSASRPEPAWRILARQFRSVVVALLVVATVLAWLTSDAADAVVILSVLLLNVAIGFATELRARRAVHALLRLDVQTAVVVRENGTRVLNARELVPGDIIELEPGQAVPADARLITPNSAAPARAC